MIDWLALKRNGLGRTTAKTRATSAKAQHVNPNS